MGLLRFILALAVVITHSQPEDLLKLTTKRRH